MAACRGTIGPYIGRIFLGPYMDRNHNPGQLCWAHIAHVERAAHTGWWKTSPTTGVLARGFQADGGEVSPANPPWQRCPPPPRRRFRSPPARDGRRSSRAPTYSTRFRLPPPLAIASVHCLSDLAPRPRRAGDALARGAQLMWSLGVPEDVAEFHDVYSLDADALEMVPQPVLAVVFCFPDPTQVHSSLCSRICFLFREF